MKNTEENKRTQAVGLVAETATSAISAGSLALATGSTPTMAAITAASAAAPGLFGALGTWLDGWRGERSKKFLAYALNPTTASEVSESDFAKYLEANAQEPWVLTTLWESLRTLDDIIDEAAIPPLGRLAREFLASSHQPDRFFRGFRRFLADSSSEELSAFRVILSFIIENTPENNPEDLCILFCGAPNRLTLLIEPSKSTEMAAGYPILLNVFKALRGSNLANDCPSRSKSGSMLPTGSGSMQISRALTIRMHSYFS